MIGPARTLSYTVVDVFTRRPLEGNPLAVFPDGSGIDDTTMQAIARELNLSETVFVLPASRPGCAARLRIFTPLRELAFAGHPTVGTAFVLLRNGIVPADVERFSLEEIVGPVPVRVEAGDRPLIWLTTPPIQEGPVIEPEICAAALGLAPADLLDTPPQLLSAGNPTLFIALRDSAAVDRAVLDTARARSMASRWSEPFCFFLFAPYPGGAYSRMFAPAYGIAEDPATGSSTGPLAAYMVRHQLVPGTSGTRFVSEQGTRMGRRSLLHVQFRGSQGSLGIEVGGYTTPVVDAVMRLDNSQ